MSKQKLPLGRAKRLWIEHDAILREVVLLGAVRECRLLQRRYSNTSSAHGALEKAANAIFARIQLEPTENSGHRSLAGKP